MRLARTRNTGLGPIRPLAPTGDASVDRSLRDLVAGLGEIRSAIGILATPQSDLRQVIARAADGDTITLLPGQYSIRQTVTVDKRLRLTGAGAQMIGAGLLWKLAADGIEVDGIQFHRTDRIAAQGAVQVDADHCLLHRCLCQSASPRGFDVVGDYCSVQASRFIADPQNLAGDSNIYWRDAAVYGIVCGSMWSATAATFVLDYRGIDNMTQAANGPAAIINVR